jgi:hypothetical protein|tara:strand:- start:266 stop:550 length:285 start_codon:yes stop_codon:yes gene_type:complete
MKLKVTSYREFDTRRGVGYESKTNIKGLSIWNDGDGGGAYFSGNEYTKDYRLIGRYSEKYNENQIEVLIDEFLGITPQQKQEIEKQYKTKYNLS